MMMETFPQTSVAKLWGEWEIRVMVLLSLILQIVLILLGNRRRSTINTWVRIVIWLAYLSADLVATISLGIISGSLTNNPSGSSDKYPGPNSAIIAFWAPFLLVHLGGPDTITAYSLEDNELWLRHLLGLVIQVGVALYVFVKTWRRSNINPLTYLAIPILVAGILKYGERSWVLWSSSSKRFRNSLLPPPKAGPDYTQLIKQRTIREIPTPENPFPEIYPKLSQTVERLDYKDIVPEATLFRESDFLFNHHFKRLYADLILSWPEGQVSVQMLLHKSPQDAFKLIEIELGTAYDALYSKVPTALSRTGMLLRSISFLSFVSALVAFRMVVVIDDHKHKYYPITDVIITYLLLVGAICIEIYAGIMLIFSERTLIRLSKHKEGLGRFVYRVISATPSASVNRKRWSGSMAQYNLIDLCLKLQYKKGFVGERILTSVKNDETLEKFQYATWGKVTIDLKELIFRRLHKLYSQVVYFSEIKEYCKNRGEYVLEKSYHCLVEFEWSVTEVEFDHSILLWHIATDLCYYFDDQNHWNSSSKSKKEISKSLSNYMLYLIVMRPLMLPKGIGEIRYRDTCAEATRFFQQASNGSISKRRSEACKLLLGVNTDKPEVEVKGEESQSVFFDGGRLAKQLQKLQMEKGWTKEEKWELISEVWVEMLCYAATHCDWQQHGKQLSEGGELLTHVCLLMAHLGFSEQYRIQKVSKSN